MAIKKLDDGRYEVDIRPTGRNGKRIRRKFDKKSEAVAFEKYTLYNHHNKEWLSKPTDKRRLSELTQIWWDLKGKHEEHGKSKEGANKRGNSSRLTQSFHFFMFEPIFSPVNALNQPI